MAVPLKFFVVFIMSITFSVINSPPTVHDLNSSKNVRVPIAMVDENVVINLVRKRRETTRGHGCPMGKIFYFTGCKTFKELEDDFITSATKTGIDKTTKVTKQKDKHIKETHVDLSVVALVTPNVTTKPSTVFNESRLSATQQTHVVTEPNINVKPLKSVVKSKFTDAEANLMLTKVTTKTSPDPVATAPRLVMKSSNKESRTIVWTEPGSVLVGKNTATSTATPPGVQQEPQVQESNPDLSVVPKSTFMKTITTLSVSQSKIVRESEVQHLKNMSELSNVTEMVPSKKAGITTLNAESDSVNAKRKPTVKLTETTPLPTGTRFTDTDSGSSTTTIISRRIPGSHLLDIFFSEFETLTGICLVVLLSIGVVLFIYYICVRKYKKSKKCQNEKEAAERKTKQMVTSNVK